jgi:hypothetical protein
MLLIKSLENMAEPSMLRMKTNTVLSRIVSGLCRCINIYGQEVLMNIMLRINFISGNAASDTKGKRNRQVNIIAQRYLIIK